MAKHRTIDPLMRSDNAANQAIRDAMPLFAPQLFAPTTRQIAHVEASTKFSQRQREIIQCLTEHGAQAIYQVAARLNVPEHAISGRFSALVARGLIEKTGERITKPGGKCPSEVYRVTRQAEFGH